MRLKQGQRVRIVDKRAANFGRHGRVIGWLPSADRPVVIRLDGDNYNVYYPATDLELIITRV